MSDKKMTLLEKLRNPAWEGDGRLSVEQTLNTMAEAADEIESLQESLDDAMNPRLR